MMAVANIALGSLRVHMRPTPTQSPRPPTPGINSSCTINDWRRSKGICTPLRECGAVISNLRSGLKPALCQVENGKAIVCCPNQPRISEIMCDKYKEELRDTRPRYWGHFPGVASEDDIPKNIVCHDPRLKPSHITRGGGSDARVDEFPHMAGLGWGLNSSKLEFRCGGTLISDEFILTAAHCIDTEEGPPSFVLLGDIRKDHLENRWGAGGRGSEKRVVIRIRDFIKHPEYQRPSYYHDIALVRLETKIKLSRSVLPACLPQPHYRLEHKENMTMLGWGLLGTGAESSDILQAVHLDRFPLNECNQYYSDTLDMPFRYPKGVLRTQLCAGDKQQSGKGSCHGDSGGPITVRNDTVPYLFHVMGITSFGARFCAIQPSVYTNVQSYLDWIEPHVWGNEVHGLGAGVRML